MSNQLIVKKSKLNGKVTLSGAKNSALRLLAASLLTDDEIYIDNFPVKIIDAQIHIQMLEKLGKVCVTDKNTITISSGGALQDTLVWEGRSVRNTLLIFGALLTRFGKAKVPLPGGCVIGDRKYDLHQMLLEKLGARIWEEECYLCGEAPNGLEGSDIFLPIRSTGATENSIIAGSLSRGITRIWNPHVRPEILDLVSFLNSMGAKIRVFGQEHIEVTGVEGLGGTTHTVIPDNTEAITWFVAAVMTGGDVEIHQFPRRDLEVPMIHLRESGARFYTGEDSLIVRGGKCYPLDISTGPFPGINSDVQPILAAYAACANGESRIIDLRFPGRYGYAEEMGKMGLQFTVKDNLLRIYGSGGKNLKGAHVKALDLRAGVALALCGLLADGETVIQDSWQIERGYNDFVLKLKSLGGEIVIE